MSKGLDLHTASPQEYMRHLRSVLSTFKYRVPEEHSISFGKELNRRYPGLLKNGQRVLGPAGNFQPVVDKLFESLITPMKPEQRRFLKENVAVGELQSLDVNAECYQVPAGRYVVFIKTGTMILLHRIIKAFSLRVGMPDHDHKKVLSFEETSKYVYQTIAMYLLYDVPLGPTIISLPRKQFDFAGALLHFTELFVLAHEFAHILEGHFSDAMILKVKMNKEEVKIFRAEWNKEYEADLCGLQLVVDTATNHDHLSLENLLSYVGPDIFFTILDLIEKVAGRTPGSYPSAISRRENLRRSKYAKGKRLEVAKRFQEISEGFWDVILQNTDRF